MTSRREIMFKISLLIGVMLMLSAIIHPVTVFAQDESQPDNGCINCHENLYFLHDTGKWFCICAEQMTCTCCHGGNPETNDEATAHQGMELYPVDGENQVCLNCHETDSTERIETFVNVAGTEPFHSQTTSRRAALPETHVDQLANSGQIQALEPWQIIGLTLTGIAFVVVVAAGFRCYRIDCLAKRKNKES